MKRRSVLLLIAAVGQAKDLPSVEHPDEAALESNERTIDILYQVIAKSTRWAIGLSDLFRLGKSIKKPEDDSEIEIRYTGVISTPMKKMEKWPLLFEASRKEGWHLSIVSDEDPVVQHSYGIIFLAEVDNVKRAIFLEGDRDGNAIVTCLVPISGRCYILNGNRFNVANAYIKRLFKELPKRFESALADEFALFNTIFSSHK